MIPEADAARLIERLERHSRRARPLLVYGLIAIVAGFLLLTWHINGLKNAAEARASDLEVKKAELRRRIDQAGRLAAGQHSAAEAPEVLRKIRAILAEASETTEELAENIEKPAVAAAGHQPHATAAAAPPPGPKPEKALSDPSAQTVQAPVQAARPAAIRIFLHIGDKEQFGGAKELQWSLAGASLDGTRSVVPGIELVEGGGDDSLRCLKRQDCARAEEVAALVNSKLRGRTLGIRNLSRTYEARRNVRPGTYEVWLKPGGPVLVTAE